MLCPGYYFQLHAVGFQGFRGLTTFDFQTRYPTVRVGSVAPMACCRRCVGRTCLLLAVFGQHICQCINPGALTTAHPVGVRLSERCDHNVFLAVHYSLHKGHNACRSGAVQMTLNKAGCSGTWSVWLYQTPCKWTMRHVPFGKLLAAVLMGAGALPCGPTGGISFTRPSVLITGSSDQWSSRGSHACHVGTCYRCGHCGTGGACAKTRGTVLYSSSVSLERCILWAWLYM